MTKRGVRGGSTAKANHKSHTLCHCCLHDVLPQPNSGRDAAAAPLLRLLTHHRSLGRFLPASEARSHAEGLMQSLTAKHPCVRSAASQEAGRELRLPYGTPCRLESSNLGWREHQARCGWGSRVVGAAARRGGRGRGPQEHREVAGAQPDAEHRAQCFIRIGGPPR